MAAWPSESWRAVFLFVRGPPSQWSSFMTQSSIDLNDVPIWGAREIGAVLNRSERKTYYMLEAGLLPAKKIGKTWVSSRRQLLALVQGEAA
jgi:hypothetical protein